MPPLAMLYRYDQLLTDQVEWLREELQHSGRGALVVGVSGGTDSAVAAALAVRTGKAVVLCHIPIESSTDERNAAGRVAAALQRPLRTFDGEGSWSLLRTRADEHVLRHHEELAGSPARARANLKSRIRAAALYYIANSVDGLVISAATRPDLALGYVTKWGDSLGDLAPLAGLLKSEVRRLAELLGIPKDVVARPASGGLWAGQTDAEELGLTEAQIEAFLTKWGDETFEVAGYITYLNLAPTEVAIVQRMKAQRHKSVALNSFPLSRERYGVTGISLTPLAGREATVLESIRTGAKEAGAAPGERPSFLEPERPADAPALGPPKPPRESENR